MAIYVYGLMRTPEGEAAATALAAAGPPEIESVAHGDVCALVSDLPEGSLRLRRESALAHADTVAAMFRHGPVLPVRFGTVLTDVAALKRDFLAPRAAKLGDRLDALDGMAEMQVRATYLEGPLLRSVLDASPRLATAAARIRKLPPEATHFDRISLGEAISQAVQTRRRSDADWLTGELSPLAQAVSVRDPRHERDVLNASFLVAAERLEAFDAEVERLSTEATGEMSFKLIGPMPTHSFAGGEWVGAADQESTWA